MKLRALLITSVLGTVASLSPVHAQAPDACTIYNCMAGISGYGTSGGPACTPSLIWWNTPTDPAGGLAVYDESGFDGLASYPVRETYLTVGCPQASIATNAAILQSIMNQWGYALVPVP